MATLKLTDGLVEAAQPEARDTYLWDAALPRFGVRITPAGARIYLVQYRARGAAGEKPKTRRITIGQHDGDLWNVTKARAQARKLLAPVDLGQDPFADREAAREAARAQALARQEAEAAAIREKTRRELETFGVLAEAFIAEKHAKRRSGAEASRLIRRDPMDAWSERHIGDIRRRDVLDLLKALTERAPAVARQTYAELRPLFEWCVERELIEVSPCASITPPPRPKSRDRVLSDSELALVWRGAERLGYPFGPVIQLMILTGQRRSEVAEMTWAEVSLNQCVWQLPADRAKNDVLHEIDLSPEALAILQAVPRTGDFLFPARGGEKPVQGFSATKRRLDKIIEALRAEDAAKAGEEPPAEPLPEWRLHDLRRTCATGLAAMRFPPEVIERILNHVSGIQSGLVGVYQRFDYRAERKAALRAWGERVAAIISGRPVPSNVVQFRPAEAS